MRALLSFVACSVCFGDPKSLQSRGALFGVLFLLGVVAAVLGSIAWTACLWTKRSKKLENVIAGD